MRRARGLVLALAIGAGGAAALLVHKAGTAKHAVPERPGGDVVEVLVAARAISAGEAVGAGNVRWQLWLKSALVAGSVERRPGVASSAPAFEAAPARYPIQAGEPIVAAKLMRPGQGGVLAMMVAPGMRAVSVPIREETAAGGFIQPQDRVDVMLTRKGRDGGGGAKGAASEIVLRGVKVLAIGRGLDGHNAAGGQLRTATLELTQAQGRRLLAAQSTGEMSLALVGASDGERPELDNVIALEPEQPVATLKFGKRHGGTAGAVQ